MQDKKRLQEILNAALKLPPDSKKKITVRKEDAEAIINSFSPFIERDKIIVRKFVNSIRVPDV